VGLSRWVVLPTPNRPIGVNVARMKRSRGNRGATAAEYALIVAGVVLVLTVGVDALKFALNAFYAGLQGDIDAWP